MLLTLKILALRGDAESTLMFCTVNVAAETISVFAENFVKTKKDCKSFVWNYFGSLINKANFLLKDLNSVYYSKCFEKNEIKTIKDTVSTTNLAQHLRDCHCILLVELGTVVCHVCCIHRNAATFPVGNHLF